MPFTEASKKKDKIFRNRLFKNRFVKNAEYPNKESYKNIPERQKRRLKQMEVCPLF